MARGILFKAYHEALIRQGRKTQTRRVTAHNLPRVGECCYVKLFLFAKAELASVWIVIDGVRQEPLGAISEADAAREGYASRAEFLEVFAGLHPGAQWRDPVHVIGFHLAAHAEAVRLLREAPKDRELADRLATRWRLEDEAA